MYEYLHIGEIVNTHGVRGEVKVVPLTDDIRRFDDLTNVYIEDNDTTRNEYEIENVRYHQQFVIIKFKGVDDMNAAIRLKTKFLAVHRSQAIKLPEDAYFICDLIGLTIIDGELGEVGKIEDVIQTGSNDVYVTTYNKKPLCIPVLKDVVNNIDIENGIVEVNIPKGVIVMRFDVLTLFPEMFDALGESIIGRAVKENKIDINVINIRDFSKDKHKRVDDYPYGGGKGMVMQPEPIYDAFSSIEKKKEQE